MNSKRAVFLILLIFLQPNVISSEIVRTEDGEVRGSFGLTRSGVMFYKFLKIPFAEPIIGDNRFKPPVAKKPWNDVIDCTNYGPMCMQEDIWGAETMSEDCLHLNVFSKNITSEVKSLKPVIAYIHGGGFESGSSIEHDPEYLMDRNIVLVTINYRLGIFGFLAVGTSEISGNAGLKDQSLALKWIQNNIKHFGGDPNKVTIAGLSAGGYSTTAHMLSPMSQGLFINVIAMSGALAWQKKLKSNNIEEAKSLATRIGCPIETINVMIPCLRNKTAREISKNMIFPFFHCPVMSWLPIVEEDLGQERFLTDEPNKLFKSGNFSKVKVMVGVTADEFTTPVASILKNSSATKLLNEKFNEIAPNCFFFEKNDQKSAKEIAESLRKSYFIYDKIDVRSFNRLNQLFADGVIGFSVHRFVNYISNFTDVYYYKFSYIGRFSLFKYPNDKIPYGVSHADDIQYVFNAPYVGSMIQLTDPESSVVERMTRIWEQFAWMGNPNNPSDEYLSEMLWPKHDSFSESYMDIGNNLVVKNGLFLERYTIWDNLESSCMMLKANLLIIVILLKLLI